VAAYTRSVADSANAVALLAGPPAAGRRLALILKQRTAEAGHPEVFDTFLRLIGAESTDGHDLPDWISAWTRAFEMASKASSDPRLAGCRLRYHTAAFEALNAAGWPQAVVWGLLSTWQIALEASPPGDGLRSEWEAFLQQLDLADGAAGRRMGELEQFLDSVEDLLDAWATEHGA
jgi:hypothetical protein